VADQHWINLERDSADETKWKTITAGEKCPIPNDWRCGALAYKLTFSSADGLKNAKVRVVEDGGNIKYSDAEQDRNINFTVQNERHGATKPDGRDTLEQWCTSILPAAGKNTYWVEVQDPETGEIKKATTTREVCRRLFYYSCVVKPVGQPDFIKPDGSVVSGAIDEGAIDAALTRMEAYHWDDTEFRILLVNKGKYSFDAPKGAVNIMSQESRDANDVKTDTTTWEEKKHEGDQATRMKEQIGAIVDITAPNAGAARQQIIDQSVQSVWASHNTWLWLDEIAKQIPKADAARLIPNYFVVAWVNNLVTRVTKSFALVSNGTFALRGRAGLAIWDDDTISLTVNTGLPLWYGLDKADDLNRAWFISCEICFEHQDMKGPDGKPLVEILTIPDNAVNPSGPPMGELGGYREVKIDMTAKELAGIKARFAVSSTVGVFYIKLKLRLADSYAAGLAFTGTNVTVIADKCLFDRNSAANKQDILHHELGHAMGMVSQGDKATTFPLTRSPYLTPDAPGSLYGNIIDGSANDNSQDHCGPHCNTGMAWTAPSVDAAGNPVPGSWSGMPGCAMWGSIGIWSTDAAGNPVLHNTPDAYCGACAPIVRKLDLTNVFPATLHGLK
jgi:hypothetical protein